MKRCGNCVIWDVILSEAKEPYPSENVYRE
jgi:hypothetical protein